MTQKKESLEDKDKLKNAKKKLSEMVYQARKRILQGMLQEAHDDLYKFITQEKDKLGGDDSVFLLPGLFTIAEIHIIENRNKKAEEYLNAAHWSFLKNSDKNTLEKKKEKGQLLTPEEQLDYKITLHRTFAKLYESKNDFKQALNELRLCTYLECTKWGPEHPYVAQNYFLLGKIFADQGGDKVAVGESFFAKTAQIWYRYLKNFFEKSPQEQQTFLIEQLYLEETLNYLIYIEKHFQEAYEEDQAVVVFTPVMRVYYSIGLLYKIFGDDEQCENYLREVYRRCVKYLPKDDRKTLKIKAVLASMNVNIEQSPKNSPMRAKYEADEDDRAASESMINGSSQDD